MKIAFEANVLTYPHTGIAKSLINLIRHLHDIEIILFTSNNKEITQNLGFSYTFINANLGGGEREYYQSMRLYALSLEWRNSIKF